MFILGPTLEVAYFACASCQDGPVPKTIMLGYIASPKRTLNFRTLMLFPRYFC